MSDKLIIGYAAGVFDLFHVGHVNILNNAKALCDKLIVGVTTDELLAEYKRKKSIIPFAERCKIVSNIKAVDAVVAQESMNKYEMWEKIKFDIMFVGDDWYNTTEWKKFEEEFSRVGVRIVFYPYTKGTSSTLINEILERERKAINK